MTAKHPCGKNLLTTGTILLAAMNAGAAKKAPVAPPVEEFRFVHLSDLHLGHVPGHPNVTKVVAEVKSLHPAFVVITGDVVEVGQSEHWEYAKPLVQDPLAGIPVHFTTGNHEVAWSGLEGKPLFRRYAGPTRYSFTSGSWFFVALDSAVPGQHHGFLGPDQVAWLDNELAGSTAPHKVVMLHSAVFRERQTRFLGDEKALYEVLALHRVRLVLCGHGHTNELWRYRDIPVVEAGAAYASGYAAFRVKGESLEVTFTDIGKDGVLKARPPNLIYGMGGGLFEPASMKVYNDSDLPGQETPVMPAGARLAWTRTLGASIQAAPLVAGGKVYVATAAGELSCLDGATGASVWTATVAGWVLSRPVLAADSVVVGSEGGELAAFRASDGWRLWTYSAENSFAAAPGVMGVSLLAATGGGNVYALTMVGFRFGDGSVGGNVSSEPAVSGGNSFFTTWNGRISAMSANGTVVWTRTVADIVYSGAGRCSPKVIGGTLVVATGTPQILGLDPADGRIRWTVAEKAGYSSPEVWRSQEKGMLGMGREKEYAVLATLDTRVCVQDPSNGRKLFEVPCHDASFSSRVAVSGDRAYAVGFLGKLYAVDLKIRDQIWTAELGNDFVFSDPVADGKMVYVGNMAGKLFALEDTARPPANASGAK
jgi:outer membrane protein assembly factor BamB/predicted phosphodiesterase